MNDASDISELSKQLGYPASESEITERLITILHSNNDIVYVAYLPDGKKFYSNMGFSVLKKQRVSDKKMNIEASPSHKVRRGFHYRSSLAAYPKH